MGGKQEKYNNITRGSMDYLTAIYEQSNDAKQYSNYLLMRCVFHDDRHPSLLVYPEWYKCLSCGASGKPKQLLIQLSSHSNIPRRDEQASVRNPFNSWLRKNDLFDLMKSAYQTLKNFPYQRSYLRKRGLSDKTITSLKLGYVDGWYTIPIISKEGKLSGALARAGESFTNVRYMMPYGQTDLLYSPDWDMVNDAKDVYLTFGTLDAISIYQLGRAAISTTSGKRCQASWFSDIRKKINIFADFGEEKDARQLASGLGWRGKIVKYRYPEHTSDPNDLLKHNLLRSTVL